MLFKHCSKRGCVCSLAPKPLKHVGFFSRRRCDDRLLCGDRDEGINVTQGAHDSGSGCFVAFTDNICKANSDRLLNVQSLDSNRKYTARQSSKTCLSGRNDAPGKEQRQGSNATHHLLRFHGIGNYKKAGGRRTDTNARAPPHPGVTRAPLEQTCELKSTDSE